MTDKSQSESEKQRYIAALQRAWQGEQAGARIYRSLAEHESNEARRGVLLKLAATEVQHGERWKKHLKELGGQLPVDHDPLKERIWRWILVQSGTENALKRIESTENDADDGYAELAELAPLESDRAEIQAVQRDEQSHARLAHDVGSPAGQPAGPQAMLDVILGRERWHKRGGGWIGQAIYGANDGLGSVFGIVSGVAGATAGGPAVLIAGLAGVLASALSMGSGAYLATKADREVQEAEIRRERRELLDNPEEEREELALFYQLKGVPEAEAQALAARLISQPEFALQTLVGEELGLSEQTFPNPWTAALSATLSTAFGAFIPIVPFFFAHGYPAIIISFAISTLAHFLIGAAKTIVTGLSPWRSGVEMTLIGLGEAVITYLLGLMLSGVVG